MDAKPTILITGANRGIGLGLTLEFVRRGWQVFAACRRPPEAERLKSLALEKGADLAVLPLDVRDQASIALLAGELAALTPSLDVLINNAAIHSDHREEKLGDLNLASIADTFAVNSLGPIAVSQALLPLLKAGRHPRVVNISSGAGSLTKITTTAHYGYSISKAALNMFVRRAAIDLQPLGITIVSISPGWVRTDMGGAGADVTLDDAAAALAKTIETLAPDQSGQWFDRFGAPFRNAW